MNHHVCTIDAYLGLTVSRVTFRGFQIEIFKRFNVSGLRRSGIDPLIFYPHPFHTPTNFPSCALQVYILPVAPTELLRQRRRLHRQPRRPNGNCYHPRSIMIYDVKSEYYAQFLSSKQGPSASKSKPGPAVVVPSAQPAPDAMDTED